ncbi:hypothetical protein Agub_g4058, partial [Astrephomene gubernaculifera]
MKNLIVEREFCACLESTADGAVANFCVSATESRLYALTINGYVLCFAKDETLTPLWRYPLDPDLLPADSVAVDSHADGPGSSRSSSWVASFSHVLELDALCIATRGGAIALLHVGEGEEPHLEQVGCVDDGLSCLEWSPDGELLAALSGAGNLLVMNQAWELLYEGCALGPAAATASAQLDPALRSALFTDGRISWRGDGKFFSVVCRDLPPAAAAASPDTSAAAAAVAASLPPYRVRIWDRSSLELHAAGEAAEGLLPLPAWQPSG